MTLNRVCIEHNSLTGLALIGFRGGEASIGKRGWEALVREQKRA